jgi:chromosomal replication initiator protein
MNAEPNLEKTWKQALKLIKDQVPTSSFQAWIKPAQLAEIKDNTAYIEVRNEFSKNLLVQNYHQTILKALESLVGKKLELVIRINSTITGDLYVPSFASLSESALAPTRINLLDNSGGDTLLSSGLNPKYTFDNFVVGAHNQFCHAVALAIAEQTNNGGYNPFFIYGGVGLGKTHIMQAVGNYMLAKNPNCRVLYITTEKFLNDLISSMRKSKMNEFRAKYRSLNLLMIDDIQFIEGKEATQEEFFHTFNTLKENGSQIILTSDRPPKAIPRLEPRLCSRFEGGLVADVHAPTYETRLAIITRKAEEMKMPLSSETADALAKCFPENIRQLEGALVKVQAYVNFTNKPVSIEMLEKLLQISSHVSYYDEHSQMNVQKNDFKMNTKTSDNVERLKKIVSDKFHIELDDLMSRNNSQEIKTARQVCIYLARSIGMSLAEISGAFDGRGNSSIINSCNKVRSFMKYDEKFKNTVQELERELKR